MRRLSLVASLLVAGRLAAAPDAVAINEMGPDGEKPRPTYQVRPEFPATLRQAGMSGEATVEFVVDLDGHVQDAHAVRSSVAAFEGPAVAAVAQWRFTPGKVHGQLVYVRMQVPIVFTLTQDQPGSDNPKPPPLFTMTLDPADVVDISRVDRQPKVLVQARPLYPPGLRAAGTSGHAIVDFIVGLDGGVVNAHSVRATAPEFGEAAVAAVGQWRFEPGIKNGHAVYTHLQVPIVFSTNDESKAGISPGPTSNARGYQIPFIEGAPDRQPIVTDQAAPEYPFSLRLGGNKGEVIVQFIVDKDGNVLNAQVIKASHPDFEAPAVEAVLQWKFKPGLKNGQPVYVKMQVPIFFQLLGQGPDGRAGGVDVWGIPPHAPKDAPPDFAYDEPPQPQLTNAPVYPFDLLTQKVSGKATVLFAIDPRGRTHIVKLQQASLPEFGTSACAMIQSWEFTPAQKAGKPCWAYLQKEIHFRMNDDEFPVSDSAIRLLHALKKNPSPVLSSMKDLDLPLKGRFQPSPVVPDGVLKAGIPAQAMITFLVDHAGHAQLPQVVSASSDEFGWAAATAVARWQFTAPTVKGRPVDVRATIPVVWNPPPAAPKAG